jgi:hypothetical protein
MDDCVDDADNCNIYKLIQLYGDMVMKFTPTIKKHFMKTYIRFGLVYMVSMMLLLLRGFIL